MDRTHMDLFRAHQACWLELDAHSRVMIPLACLNVDSLLAAGPCECAQLKTAADRVLHSAQPAEQRRCCRILSYLPLAPAAGERQQIMQAPFTRGVSA